MTILNLSEGKFSLMQKINRQYLLPFVVIIIPINLYFIGDNLGIGIQLALFRYQITYLGPSFITLPRDLSLVFTGILHGRTAWSIMAWAEGTILLLLAFYLHLFNEIPKILMKEATFSKTLGALILSAGILFLISCMLQYGPFLKGNAGSSVPIGIPFIFYLSYFIWKSEHFNK